MVQIPSVISGLCSEGVEVVAAGVYIVAAARARASSAGRSPQRRGIRARRPAAVGIRGRHRGAARRRHLLSTAGGVRGVYRGHPVVRGLPWEDGGWGPHVADRRSQCVDRRARRDAVRRRRRGARVAVAADAARDGRVDRRHAAQRHGAAAERHAPSDTGADGGAGRRDRLPHAVRRRPVERADVAAGVAPRSVAGAAGDDRDVVRRRGCAGGAGDLHVAVRHGRHRHDAVEGRRGCRRPSPRPRSR